jgi:hypothetical protein
LSPFLPETASSFSERQYRFPDSIATCGHPRKKKKNKKRLGLAGEGNPAVKTIRMPSMLEFYRHVMW